MCVPIFRANKMKETQTLMDSLCHMCKLNIQKGIQLRKCGFIYFVNTREIKIVNK